jgi:chromosome segregation ATPase
MCNYLTKSGNQCKLESNKIYCHIHKKLIIKYNLKKEIVNLNKTIEKKVNKIKELNNNLNSLKYTINELNNKINEMNENYEKYELIKKYTILKKQLIKINNKTTPYNILTNPYYKNIVETKFKKPQDFLLKEFTDLRNHRNDYCH